MTHPFEPRFRALAGVTIAIGLAIAGGALAGVLGDTMTLPALGVGLLGLALGVVYLVSPTWKLAVVTSDEGLRVELGHTPKFELLWSDVQAVVASPTTQTCFVDGGTSERSLLVPGDGAPASYRLAGRPELYQRIVSSVSSDRITYVDTLDAVP